MCCLKYMVLRGFHVYKSVFLGWLVGRFNMASYGGYNCGVPLYKTELLSGEFGVIATDKQVFRGVVASRG